MYLFIPRRITTIHKRKFQRKEPSADEDVEKIEHFHIVGGTIN